MSMMSTDRDESAAAPNPQAADVAAHNCYHHHHAHGHQYGTGHHTSRAGHGGDRLSHLHEHYHCDAPNAMSGHASGYLWHHAPT